MIKMICYFCPAVLSLCIFESLKKTTLSLKNSIYCFNLNVILINFMCFVVKKLILHTSDLPMLVDGGDMSVSVAINYMIMALFFAIVFAILEVFVSKNMRVIVEDATNEEEK